MRLTDFQIKVLVAAAREAFGENATIWLFGSRVYDNEAGGDIDICIETDLIEGIVAGKLKMRSLLRQSLGEQKIDILVRSRSDAPSPMHKIAMAQGVVLFQGNDRKDT